MEQVRRGLTADYRELSEYGRWPLSALLGLSAYVALGFKRLTVWLLTGLVVPARWRRSEQRQIDRLNNGPRIAAAAALKTDQAAGDKVAAVTDENRGATGRSTQQPPWQR